MRIGILCPAEIAARRFMPALKKAAELYPEKDIAFCGVGTYTAEERFGEASGNTLTEAQIRAAMENDHKKAAAITGEYGGKIYESYAAMLASGEADAVYLPLVPSRHYAYTKMALENGLHVFCEKPFGTSYAETAELIALARKKGLALHENYAFLYHAQMGRIFDLTGENGRSAGGLARDRDAVTGGTPGAAEAGGTREAGLLGEVRLVRTAFGFPPRAAGDFRYNKEAGGGALLDAGGYVIRMAASLLEDDARVISASLYHPGPGTVDMAGAGELTDKTGRVVQVAFGMHHQYKCELELWGSNGTLHTGRIFTAPEGFSPAMNVTAGSEARTETLPADDAFLRSLEVFLRCVSDEAAREESYREIEKQSRLLQDFNDKAIRTYGTKEDVF